MCIKRLETNQAVVSSFEQLRIPPVAIEEFKAIFAKGPAMENSIVSALTVRDIAFIFTASHFEVRGSSNLGSAHKGTRPGHPYADVVFSFAFHQVLKALAMDFDTDELRPNVPTATIADGERQQGEDVRLPLPAFFDDCVLVVIATTPEELIPKCARVLENKENLLRRVAWKSMTVLERQKCSYNLIEQVLQK